MPGLTQREVDLKLFNEIPIRAPTGPQPPQTPDPPLPRTRDTWLRGVSAARGRRASLRVWSTCAGRVGEGRSAGAAPAPTLSRTAVNAPIRIFLPPFF